MRDENLRSIRKQGRKSWKQTSGYHVRSLAETAMFRMKTIFGSELSARLLETQITQALIRCVALNRMTYLGMPKSYKVDSLTFQFQAALGKVLCFSGNLFALN